jgi:mono/diheme cytochrome c family protein
MIRFLSGLALVPLLAGPCLACPGVAYRSTYVTPVYETPVIVTPAIVTQFVAIPTYSATYLGPVPALAAPVAPQAAPVASQGPSVCESRLQALTDRLAALESRQGPSSGVLAAPDVPQALPPPAPKATGAPAAPGMHPGQIVFNGKCAACHDAAKLKDKQPAFQRDGQLIGLDCLTALDSAVAVAKGTMPPAGKQLNEQEALDLVEWLKAQAHNQPKK